MLYGREQRVDDATLVVRAQPRELLEGAIELLEIAGGFRRIERDLRGLMLRAHLREARPIRRASGVGEV